MNDSRPTSQPADRPEWEALTRFHAGECSDAERESISQWLSRHPVDAQLMSSLADVSQRAADMLGGEQEFTVDVERALERVKGRMDEPTVLPFRSKANVPPRSSFSSWRTPGLAAAALALIAINVWRWESKPDLPSPTRTLAVASSALKAGSSFATTVGVRDSVRLPDGTQVILAPASRLTLAADYGASSRAVTLEGQAQFAVRHDSAAPFTVRAGDAVIRDIGTIFVVRSSGAGKSVATSLLVTEGRASIRPAASQSGEVTLAAGDRAELLAGGNVTVSRGVVSEADAAWTSGRLVYHAAPLSQVLEDLGRWYGVVPVVDPPLANHRLTASFAEGEPVAGILKVIALSIGAEVTQVGDTVVLRPGSTRTR